MRNRTACWTAALTAAFLVLAVGCQADRGESCDADVDCASGLVCNQFTMRCSKLALICETDDDCADMPGTVCSVDHECATDVATVDAGPDTVDVRDVVVVRDLPQADFMGDVDFPECPALPTTMLRATTCIIGPDGTPGNGLDVDGDPETCAPEGQCSDGIDNAAGLLGQLANEFMNGAVADRELNVLFTTWPETPDTCPFLLLSRTGDPVGEDASTAYAVLQEDETGDCAPGVRFEDACMTDGVLEAGRYADADFPLALNIMGMVFRLPLHQARLVGTVSGSRDEASFVLAGWILRDELMTAIDNVPAETVPDGVNPAGVKTFINSLPMEEDLDTDGDSTPDALSVGIVVEVAPVDISGFAE